MISEEETKKTFAIKKISSHQGNSQPNQTDTEENMIEQKARCPSIDGIISAAHSDNKIRAPSAER